MAKEIFIDNLRTAARWLPRPTVNSELGKRADAHLASVLYSADVWLTSRSVDGFDPADYEDWPKREREQLAKDVADFLAIAMQVPANKPASEIQSRKARTHLEGAMEIVRRHLVREWRHAQDSMLSEAKAAAASKHWYVEQDEKDVSENLLGDYKAPRLRVRTPDKEVVLDPIAYFGSGRQGVVDLVVLPTYETEYLITFKNACWQIVSRRGTFNSRPFTQRTFVNSIARL